MYQRERALMDRWADWRTLALVDRSLWFRSENIIAKAMKHGIRVSPSHYGSEPVYDDTCHQIDRFMGELRSIAEPAHRALMARHCGVVGAVNLGEKPDERRPGRYRRYFESEVASILFGGKGPSVVMRYRRACEEGYRRLKSIMP
jgi:hypothetical protein